MAPGERMIKGKRLGLRWNVERWRMLLENERERECVQEKRNIDRLQRKAQNLYLQIGAFSFFCMGDNINIFHLYHFQVFTNELVKEINSYLSTQRILTEKNTLKEKALNSEIKERIFAHFLFVCLYLEY